MKRLKWKNIGILALVLGLLGYLGFAVVKFSHRDDNKKCQHLLITVKDSAQLKFLTSKDIFDALVKNKIRIKWKKRTEIRTENIEQMLYRNPAIKKVDCYFTSSGDVSIDVWQREPLFRVTGVNNYYVDVYGKILPVSNEFVLYVPVVTGSVNKQYATTKLKDFVLFLQKNDFWSAQVEQIDVSPDSEIVLIPRVGEHEIELGTLDDYPQKLEKLKTFYVQGLNKIGWGDYKSISLKYKNQVVCTKK